MATRLQKKLSLAERRIRKFSDSFKLQKVREIETGKSKVSDICKEYEVSYTSVYNWLERYGLMKEKTERLVVESESDTKQLIFLKKKVADLEQLVGQKQIQLEFTEKMIDLAEELYGINIKKKFSTKQSSISGETENKTTLV